MKEKELKELKLTKNIIIPFPNFQQNTIISPTQMNDNFEEIEHAYNTLIDNHNGAITKVNKALAEITSSDNEALTNEQFRVQAENIRVQNEEERIANEEERKTEETKRIAMYNTHLNDEIRREQKHIQMVSEFDLKKTELDAFIGEKEEEVQNAINSIPTKEELKGEKGDKGDRGEKGKQGERGLQGIQGIQGLKGDKGDKGEQGERGLQGIQGLKGDKGDKGDKGEKGDKGDPGQNTIIDYIYEEVNSPNPSVSNSIEGSLEDIQILGNTVQDPDNLADIKSVGVLQEDGTYKMSILSCGKNLLNIDGEYETPKTSEFCCETLGKVLKLKPNTTYRFKGNMKKISGTTEPMYTGIALMLYDNSSIIPTYWYPNNGGIKVALNEGTQYTFDTSFTTNQTDIYLRVLIGRANNKNSVINLTNIQLEEGTVATPYEPYQENKCDILLPCQLEKVGDVADRLYYDDVEKAWCIEKNFETRTLTENESWIVKWVEQNNTIGFGFKMPGVRVESIHTTINYALCDRFILPKVQNSSYYEYDVESFTVWDSSDQIGYIKINKNKLNSVTVDGFREWLKNNPTTIKYQLTTPQKIVLPLSTQIALNSFFGTTHVYMESGEVEGTIKCKIPKSLGATVQSLNNKTDILSDRIEAIEGLKDSQNMKYETDKGYLVCKETKNGVIDDLKIEGKTLVNLSTLRSKTLNNATNEERRMDFNPQMFKEGREYTIILNVGNVVNGTSTLHIQWDFINGAQKYNTINSNVTNLMNSKVVYKFKQDEFPDAINRVYLSLNTGNPSNCTCEINDCIVLEGDHTQNPPSYFEGLMSVGEDVDNIVVESVNENLFDIDNGFSNTLVSHTVLNDRLSIKITNSTHNGWVTYNLPDNHLVEGEVYTFSAISEDVSSDNVYTQIVDGEGKHYNADRNVPITFTKKGKMLIRLYCNLGKGVTRERVFYNITLTKGTTSQYTPHQSDKKQILFYNSNGELEPIQELHEWDSIEKHSDNKWYYHKRSGKVVLNGSEDWKSNVSSETTISFRLPYSVDMLQNLICDRFIHDILSSSNGIEGILISKTNTINEFSIEILKSKLSTQDVQGFKQWLQANNVTVVYQLAEEEIYELAPLHLDSYANETLILCNSGAISPKMEFSITSHINELVKSQGDRISLLEEKMYKALKQVLAGDMYSLAELLYPEDFVSKEESVDVPTLLI